MAKRKPKFVTNVLAKLSARGREILDPTPVAGQIGYKPSKSQADRLRDMIRSENLRLAAEQAGMETFDEADDFDVEDDPVDPTTPYEEVFEGDVLLDAHKLAEAKKTKPTPAVDTGKKTFTGEAAKKLVEFLRTAPQSEVDKLIPPDKE